MREAGTGNFGYLKAPSEGFALNPDPDITPDLKIHT